jgi:hypothetical protein
MESTATSQQPL